jgi:ATP adenylyltransferase
MQTFLPEQKVIFWANRAPCPFCSVDLSDVAAANDQVLAIRVANPITPLHTFVVPRRHVANYFDLFLPEMMEVDEILRSIRKDIALADATVVGFNVEIDIGTCAGQTILHCHVHLIPRRVGDVADPRGGLCAITAGETPYIAQPHGPTP